MAWRALFMAMTAVAPLAGSVDRNNAILEQSSDIQQSLPSRGAWIEIPIMPHPELLLSVAPLAGSVDRNSNGVGPANRPYNSRSPRGERG